MTHRHTTAQITSYLTARREDLRRDPDLLPRTVTWAVVGMGNWSKHWSRDRLVAQIDRYLRRPHHKQRRRKAITLAVDVARYWGIVAKVSPPPATSPTPPQPTASPVQPTPSPRSDRPPTAPSPTRPAPPHVSLRPPPRTR